MTREEALWYLAAIIDGEGCISFSILDSGTLSWQECYVANTELPIVRRVVACLDLIGVDCNVYLQKGTKTPAGGVAKPIYQVRITGRQNFELLSEVPLASEAKAVKLHQILTSYVNPKPHKRTPKHTRPVGW